MKRLTYGLLFTLFYLPTLVSGQEEIFLNNASFEGPPMHSTTPYGWENCGFPDESPPDTQPGEFEVVQPAADKRSYIGLVTRDNDTWERVAQKLTTPLQSGECYDFSLYLARSVKYISPSKITGKDENFREPVKLRIWGGNSSCHTKELLAESPVITHNNWKKYEFKLNPSMGSHRYIMLEAHYKPGEMFPYNGNILIDGCSSIKTCTKELAVVEEPEVKPTPVTPDTPEPPVVTPEPVKPEPVAVEPEPAPALIPELDRKKLVKGDVIRVNKLQFQADTSSLTPKSRPALDEIYTFLKNNPDVAIEIGGHTNGIPDHRYCDWLSEQRAKTVADFLLGKGIPEERVSYKGYGKRKPIASNQTKEGRRKNQRVEIKILELKESR